VEITEEILSKNKSRVWVMHGGAEEEGRKTYELFSQNPKVTHLGFGDISPVAGVHTGPGLIGIVIMKEI
jgi:fatty acid-binding protein DegV